MKILNILVISIALLIGYMSNKKVIDDYSLNTTNEFITQMSDIDTSVKSIDATEKIYEFQLKQINVYAEWSTSYEDSVYLSCDYDIDAIETPIVGVNVENIEPIEDIKIALNLI